MKRNLLIIALPAAIAASFLAGCGSPGIVARTNPGRPSIVQVSEGYDTVGRRWEDQTPKSASQRIYPTAYQPAAQTKGQPVSQTTSQSVVTTTIEPAPETTSQPAQPKMLTRSESQSGSYTGTITDIDYAAREVTLADSQGETQTFAVGKDVQRFNEAKVGDKVLVSYYLGINAEVRKPTAEEQQSPLTVLEATGRASADEDPAAAGARKIRAVVTIEALNRANQSITVKGPRGRSYTALVADPSRFDDVHIGDTIVMTFTEAMVVSLNPAQ